MDSQTLVNRVYEETGIRIEKRDPVFAVVTLNEAVIQDMVQQHVQQLDQQHCELTLKHQQWEKRQEAWLTKTEQLMAQSLDHAVEAAKIDIRTVAKDTAIAVAKEAFTLQIKPAISHIEDASRRLDACARDATDLIKKAAPSPEFKLWERCFLIACSALIGSMISLFLFGWLIKSGRLMLYEPSTITAKDIAQEVSKQLPKRK